MAPPLMLDCYHEVHLGTWEWMIRLGSMMTVILSRVRVVELFLRYWRSSDRLALFFEPLDRRKQRLLRRSLTEMSGFR